MPATAVRRGSYRGAIVLGISVAWSPAVAQLTPEQVTSLQTVGSVTISPDARWVAYTLAQPRAADEDTIAGLRAYSELWVVPVAGGAPRAIVQRPNWSGSTSTTCAGFSRRSRST